MGIAEEKFKSGLFRKTELQVTRE